MDKTITLDRYEAERIYRLLKADLDWRFATNQKPGPDPLYDRFAAFVGENSSKDHIEAVELMREEQREEDRREWCEADRDC